MNKGFTNLTKGFAVACLLVLTCCVFVAKSYAQTVQNFTNCNSAETWTVPAGVYAVEIQCWGAGGNGGCVNSGTMGAGGGGGGGYAKRIMSVTPGQDLLVTVGKPAAIDATSSSPAAGGSSKVTSSDGNTIYIEAYGGASVPKNTKGYGAGGYYNTGCSGVEGSRGSAGVGGTVNPTAGAGGHAAESAIMSRLGLTGFTGDQGSGVSGCYSDDGFSGSKGGGGGGGALRCDSYSGTVTTKTYKGGQGGQGLVSIKALTCSDVSAGTISAGSWNCNATPISVQIGNNNASPANGTFSWQKSTDNGNNWTNIAGAQSQTYNADATGMYRCGYTWASCPTQYTDAVSVLHPNNVALGAIQLPSHVTSVCAGASVVPNFSASTTPEVPLIWEKSNDNTNWSTFTPSTTEMTLNAPLYVRYKANISNTCKLQSSTVYAIQTRGVPVVNSITAPTDLCPSTSFALAANVTPATGSSISTYTWTGATGTTANATITDSKPRCAQTYNYGLKVTDANGCESAEKTGSFTTDASTLTVGTVAAQTASHDEGCLYIIPDVTEAVRAQVTSSCPFTVRQSPAAGGYIAQGNHAIAVYVKNACGDSVSVVVDVDVPQELTVNITSDPAGGYICQGGLVNLIANATVDPSLTATYAWSTNATQNSSELNKASANNGASVSVGAVTYQVTVTESNGCSKSAELEVIPLPLISGIEDQVATICSGSGYEFAPTGVHEMTKYTWALISDPINSATAQSTPQSSFKIESLTNNTLNNQTVVYAVSPVTTPGGDDAIICMGTPFRVTLTVKPTIKHPYAISSVEDQPAVLNGTMSCEYVVPDLTNYVADRVASSSIVVTNKQQDVAAGSVVALGTTKQVTVTLTDACNKTRDVVVDVVAPAAPTVNVTTSTNVVSGHTCQGEAIDLQATATCDPTVYIMGYNWENASVVITDQTRATAVATPVLTSSDPQRYTVTANISDGCTVSATTEVYVHPNATVLTGKKDTICTGDDYSYTPTGAPTNTTYTWTVKSNTDDTNNAAAQPTAQSNFNIESLTNATLTKQTVVYEVTPSTITTVDGVDMACTGTPFDITLVVRPSIENEGAVRNFTTHRAALKDASACLYAVPDFSTTLRDSIAPGIGVRTIAQSVEANTNMEAGETAVTVTITDSCGNVKTLNLTVTVPTPPTVSLASDLEGTHICEGETINFEATATVDASVTVTDYAWSTNVTPKLTDATKASTTATPLLTAAIPQSYSVMVTASDGCTAKDTVKISVHPKAMDIADKTATICPNTAFEYAPEGVPATTTYTWTVKSNTDNTNNAAAQTTAQDNFNIAGLTNTTLENQTVVYEVTPATTTDIAGEYTCTGEPFEVALTVRPSINNEGAVAAIDNQKATLADACKYVIPDLTAVANAAVASGITVATIAQSVDADTEVELGSTTPVSVTITDACGTSKVVTVNVIAPNAPTVSVVSDATNNHACHGDAVNFTATATVSDWPEITIQSCTWTEGLTVDADDNSKATRPATTDASGLQLVRNTYTVNVLATDGCTARAEIEITTLPKADRIADKTDETCMPAGYEYAPANVPTGTTYTWTVKENSDATNNAAAQTAAQTSFNIASLTNTTLAYQTVVYEVTPITATVDNNETYTCTGETFDVTLTVKPSITTEGAITDFTNQDVNITLWYGACDTAYFVQTPTYVNHIAEYENLIALTNDKSATANQGTMFGRMTPGTYTITWKLTDPCGNFVTYPQNFIVSYPVCGDELTATDGDGNTYETVRVGCECWTKSNMRSTTYTDGSEVAFANVYTNPETPAVDEETFGLLYTWYSAMHVTEGDDAAVPTISTADGSGYKYVQGVCPEGWAIPTVVAYQQATANADAVKSTDANAWLPGSTATDALGFSAYGAGYYESSSDRYVNLLGESYFWSAEMSSVVNGTCSAITHTCPQGIITDKIKGEGFSVRCVKRSNN